MKDANQDRQITEEELRKYDGQDGRPAYVAFKGKVYDVSGSKLWPEGMHQRRHKAGKDLTDDIAAAPHTEAILQRVPAVGTLIKASVKAPEKEMSPLLRFYLDLHPHPVSTHFPIALTLAATAFLILHFLTGIDGLVDSAYYTLLAGIIISPLTMLTGASSWWFNYQHKLTGIFKGKASLSVTLFVVEVVTITLWATHRQALLDRQCIGWTYFALAIVMSGLVLLLGRLGGQIVFPPRPKKNQK